jgi:hypothetical protein
MLGCSTTRTPCKQPMYKMRLPWERSRNARHEVVMDSGNHFSKSVTREDDWTSNPSGTMGKMSALFQLSRGSWGLYSPPPVIIHWGCLGNANSEICEVPWRQAELPSQLQRAQQGPEMTVKIYRMTVMRETQGTNSECHLCPHKDVYLQTRKRNERLKMKRKK